MPRWMEVRGRCTKKNAAGWRYDDGCYHDYHNELPPMLVAGYVLLLVVVVSLLCSNHSSVGRRGLVCVHESSTFLIKINFFIISFSSKGGPPV